MIGGTDYISSEHFAALTPSFLALTPDWSTHTILMAGHWRLWGQYVRHISSCSPLCGKEGGRHINRNVPTPPSLTNNLG